MTRVQQVGDRIEELLGVLRAGSGHGAAAEELVGLVVGLYGDGLAHIVAALRDDGAAGSAILDRLTDDPLVESLLLLHGLHPLDVDARIQRALDRVRPYLGSHAGGVHYLGVTDGVAHLRLEGNCHGCPSSTVTVQLAIEGAVQDAAPEVTEVRVEGMTEPPGPPAPVLLQIGPRPGTAEPGGADNGHGAWVRLPDIGPPSSRPVTTSAGGMEIVVCSVRGTLYAYRNACAACGAGMGGGRLEREVLTCECGEAYDVSRAGRALSDPALHLDPLPLITDSQGVRVAVPAGARS
jgi:Fe-S cluster biogenesis protein NfuA/nitrite reductase/ring-hydroxylating ferredoxin subunit